VRQQRSYHRLLFHLVFSTKHREHLIEASADGRSLLGFFKVKAHALEGWIEEFGCWRDHVHLLVRIPPKLELAKLYGQMKGFSAWAWNERYPDRPFAWQDGVFSITVDPDDCEALRQYIRWQWEHHEQGTSVERWEPPAEPGCPPMP
jgi:REP element-mobilizing transposase RayT